MEKNYSISELELLAVVCGLEGFQFHLHVKQVQLFWDLQAFEPLFKRNRANYQYSAQLTRWLDRLNHIDISPKHIAGKEIKFYYQKLHQKSGTGSKLQRRICNQRPRAVSKGKRPCWTDFQSFKSRVHRQCNKHA